MGPNRIAEGDRIAEGIRPRSYSSVECVPSAAKLPGVRNSFLTFEAGCRFDGRGMLRHAVFARAVRISDARVSRYPARLQRARGGQGGTDKNDQIVGPTANGARQ